MKNKITILIISAAVLATGTYFYVTNKKFSEIINKNIIGKEKSPDIKKEYCIYTIADGTYSNNTDYAIPQVDTGFISRMIDSIHFSGSGKFWLSYIDRDSKNNKSLYFAVPAVSSKEIFPEERNGESSFDYQDRIKKWKERNQEFSQDSAYKEIAFSNKKIQFIRKCDSLLNKTIYVRSNENKYSDVIGTLNSAFRSVSNNSDVNVEKYVIAFSDLQQDTPNLNPLPELQEIPEKVKLISTNPAPGSSNKCTDEVEEIESSERVFEVIFK